jgi:hypothetical protein
MLRSHREIEECLIFLRGMSFQWETARHCHMTLSLLSTKIKQMEDDPNPAVSSHSYALRTVERAKDSRGQSNSHGNTRSGCQSRSRAEQVYPTDPESLQTFIYDHGEPRIPSAPVISEHQTNFHGDASAIERPSPQILEVQNMDTNYLTGGSSFDLNMGDLFQGSNFDSLLDMIGQQYPGF